MKVAVTIDVPTAVAEFYQKVGESAGVTMSQIMSDLLTNMAGELSLEALHKKGIEPEDIRKIVDARGCREES